MYPEVHSRTDVTSRTAVIETQFDHPIEIVWTLFADPTKLAAWWGPPGFPLTVHRHKLEAGGIVELAVTTPDGDMIATWNIRQARRPTDLRFTMHGNHLEPSEVTVNLNSTGVQRTAMTITVSFASETALHHAISIGVIDGVVAAVGSAHQLMTRHGA